MKIGNFKDYVERDLNLDLKPAIPALKELSRSGSVEVRKIATETLAELGASADAKAQDK